jgi:hypothetical protein
MNQFCSFVREKFAVGLEQKIFPRRKRSLLKSSWSRDQSVPFIVSLLTAPLLRTLPTSSATSSDSCRAEGFDKWGILFSNILRCILLIICRITAYVRQTDRHDDDDDDK